MVGGVGNVGNASEDVRSKIRAMTCTMNNHDIQGLDGQPPQEVFKCFPEGSH